MNASTPATAASEGLTVCHICHKLAANTHLRCPRCGTALHERIPDSLHRTLALLITAAVLYVPANVLPIMATTQFGQSIDSTILGGIMLLIKLGSYPIAAIIFIASVLVPLGKLVALTLLCWTVARGHVNSQRERVMIYRLLVALGRWSMIDVFVVATLVALIQLGGLLSIQPGSAALAYTGVVITTMLAAEHFDPRLIWDQTEPSHE
jgi:paraquat-inducible protein A